MPKLAAFIACERVIIEAESRLVSAIAMFSRLEAQVMEKPPENAVIPKEWAFLIAWDPYEGDEGKELTQCIEIFFPDGKPFIEKTMSKFKIDDLNLRIHNTVKLLGFPIGQQGKCEGRVWIESDGELVGGKYSIFLSVAHKLVATQLVSAPSPVK
jgi:hypothetical protein